MASAEDDGPDGPEMVEVDMAGLEASDGRMVQYRWEG